MEILAENVNRIDGEKINKRKLFNDLEIIENYIDELGTMYCDPLSNSRIIKETIRYHGRILHPITVFNIRYIVNHSDLLNDNKDYLVSRILKFSEINSDDIINIKYELTDETINIDGRTLYRIKAVEDIPSINVSAGELGGYIEKESNLSQYGDCWIFSNAIVFGDARITGNAHIHDNSIVWDKARISSNVDIIGNSRIFGNVKIYGNVNIENGWVYDNAKICGYVMIGSRYNDSKNTVNKIYGNTIIDIQRGDEVYIINGSEIFGNSKITHSITIDNSTICTEDVLIANGTLKNTIIGNMVG